VVTDMFEGTTISLGTRLEARRIAIRAPQTADVAELRAILSRNVDHLRPWSPSPPAGTNPLGFAELGRSIAKQRRDWKAGNAYVFVVLLRAGREPIIGRVALTSVTRGAWQCAQVGYWLDAGHGGRGLMSEALELALTFAFERIGLHRLQAAVMPRNEASRRVLTRHGFREEGYAERYLRIGGAWEDHIIHGLTQEEWSGVARRDGRAVAQGEQLAAGSSR
jgi:ribosomal-protein-alanine N-acetyltransferase